MIGTLSAGQAAVLAALGVCCLVFGGLLAAELTEATAPVTAASAASRPVPPPPAESQHSFALPPLDAFAEVVERPLFAASRRPAAPPATSGEDEAPASVTLAGILTSTAGDRVAFLKRQGGGASALREGQKVGGWTVTSILADRVVLQCGAVRQELTMPKEEAPAAPKRASGRR